MNKVKPRVKVPKKTVFGEIIEIKTLIRHPMHSGRMKDAKGEKIPRQIINTFNVKFNGRDIFRMTLEPSISTNPYVAFPFKVKETGVFDFEWIDDNKQKYNISKTMIVSKKK